MKYLRLIFITIIFSLIFSCVTKDDQIVKIKKISIRKIVADAENIDNSYWVSKTNNQSLYYNFKVYFNENDLNKDDIAYCRVYNKFETFWTIKHKENFNDEELYFAGYHYYDTSISNNGSLLGVKDLKFEIVLTNGNRITYYYNYDLADDKTGNVQFVYNEDYNGVKDENYMQIIKRAIIKNGSKNENDLKITFTIDDNKVFSGYLWFYDKNFKYIGKTDINFINQYSKENAKYLNNGNAFYTDGKENTIILNKDEIKLKEKYLFNDITSCFVALIDGKNNKNKGDWEFRSISKRIFLN